MNHAQRPIYTIQDAITTLATILENNAQSGQYLPYEITPFDTPRMIPPKIPLEEYLIRIVKLTSGSFEYLCMLLILLDRFIIKTSIPLRPTNVHRLLLMGYILSEKILNDCCPHNVRFAKIGGISLEETNTLELCFLLMLQFEMNVELEVFSQYSAALCSKTMETAQKRRQAEWNATVDTWLNH